MNLRVKVATLLHFVKLNIFAFLPHYSSVGPTNLKSRSISVGPPFFSSTLSAGTLSRNPCGFQPAFGSSGAPSLSFAAATTPESLIYSEFGLDALTALPSSPSDGPPRFLCSRNS